MLTVQFADEVVALAPVVIHDAHGEGTEVRGNVHFAAAVISVEVRLGAGLVQQHGPVEIPEERVAEAHVRPLRVIIAAVIAAARVPLALGDALQSDADAAALHGRRRRDDDAAGNHVAGVEGGVAPLVEQN